MGEKHNEISHEVFVGEASRLFEFVNCQALSSSVNLNPILPELEIKPNQATTNGVDSFIQPGQPVQLGLSLALLSPSLFINIFN